MNAAVQVPRLRVVGVGKTYGGSIALTDATLSVAPGEVVALIGHNGAGKSTLSKIVAGYVRQDAGYLELDGERIDYRSPKQAISHGVALVPQQLAIIPEMSVVQNLVLGLRKRPDNLEAVCQRLGLADMMGARAGVLGPAAQRLVMIGRSLIREPRLLILDEPTAAFSITETESLFRIIRDLVEEQISVIYVSHRLEEILQVADRVVGMSQGRVISDVDTADVTADDLADIIAGGADAHSSDTDAEVAFVAEDGHVQAGHEVLSLTAVKTPVKRGLATLTIRAGEVVGLTGLVGAGRSTLLHALWGTGAPMTHGSVSLMGEDFAPRSPRRAMRKGMVLIPEDRQRTSLVPGLTVRENVALPTSRTRRIRMTPIIDRRRERRDVTQLLAELDTKPENPADMRIGSLSGGNQQKAVLARWLMVPSDLILLDEPCEGVDIKARREIHTVLRGLANHGKGVLVSSSDVEELVEASDRILVMRDGEIVDELSGTRMTVENVNRACL